MKIISAPNKNVNKYAWEFEKKLNNKSDDWHKIFVFVKTPLFYEQLLTNWTKFCV